MDILGAIVDRNARILIMVLNAKRDANAVDIYAVILTDVHIKVKICSNKTKNRVKTQTCLNLLYNFCHISSIYWHLDVYINKTNHKKVQNNWSTVYHILTMTRFCYYSTNSETKIKPNFKQFDQPTYFDVFQNHHQYISTYYKWLYESVTNVRTSLRSKYFSYSIMSYDFNYVSTSVDSPFKSRITKEIFIGYSFI